MHYIKHLENIRESINLIWEPEHKTRIQKLDSGVLLALHSESCDPSRVSKNNDVQFLLECSSSGAVQFIARRGQHYKRFCKSLDGRDDGILI